MAPQRKHDLVILSILLTMLMVVVLPILGVPYWCVIIFVIVYLAAFSYFGLENHIHG